MIFVTVGMYSEPFDRLVRAADELASLVAEPMIIQRGVGLYEPKFAQYVDFVDETQMETWLTEARVVVSHAGAGAILDVLRAGKPLVLVPRMQDYGEHLDDHQFELTEAMVERRRAVMVIHLSAEILVEAIAQAVRLDREVISETGLHIALRDWLAGQAAQPSPRWWGLFRWKRKEG